ncbi:hypothetical protein V2O64_00075 [Verrucomicrobiaceae bacterium 227]
MRQHLGHLSVFIPGHLLASGMESGAMGAYSNMACLNPAATQKWTNQIHSDLPAALKLEKRINVFMREAIVPYITQQKYCNAACDRLMALIGNWTDIGSSMRWPYRSIPAEDVPAWRKIAHHLIPEFVSKP